MDNAKEFTFKGFAKEVWAKAQKHGIVEVRGPEWEESERLRNIEVNRKIDEALVKGFNYCTSAVTKPFRMIYDILVKPDKQDEQSEPKT